MTRRRLALATAVGYALGSVPSAEIVSRVRTGDARAIRVGGSRNPGARNARLVLGTTAGAAVLVADVAKGAAACVAGGRVGGDAGAHVAGVAAVFGHCYPATARFDGGKGIATSFGQCLATFPAFAPFDVAIAVAAHRLAAGRRPALAAAAVSAAAWIAGGELWRRRRLPNLWGPPPTALLPRANAATAAVLALRSLHLASRARHA
ncbi:MAG TPA: glycerol-3-phosphate acyltransferase [Gaiellaceae bacterium]|nr:glycerol-3-phosphate acyltransferase [Gaiellaceae bacterium]